ncbi:MAG: GSCFA domain-containing protein, partial [Zavarzinia sp.]|nr:GSCFA domain-containing protein [Zavarzinia sp.]
MDDDDGSGSDGQISVTIDGKSVTLASSFFRGDTTTFHPQRQELHSPGAVSRYFLSGWVPESSPSTGGENVLILGEDIAPLLAAASRTHGLSVLDAAGGTDARSPETLRKTIESALAPKSRKAQSKKSAAMAAAIADADIIVLALSECSAGRALHAEMVEDLNRSYELLRAARPTSHIVLLASPCPPARVEGDQAPAITVTAAKATLRSTVDEVYRQHSSADERLGYFPAFELVSAGLNYPYTADRRTLADHTVSLLQAAFARAYGAGFDDDALAAAHVQVRAADIEAGLAMRRLAESIAPDAPLAAPGTWPGELELLADRNLDAFAFNGLMPKQPFINADRTVIAFGSCFANNISRYLNSIGYNVATRRDAIAYVSRMGDGIVNTYAIRQQFEWAWENRKPQVELWHDYKATEFGYDEGVRLRTKELFDMGDLFIITLGLSEVWYDEVTGEVFWRAVPADKYDPSRHKFRMIDQAESLANITAIYSLIRKHRPGARIVFTVSPIPLMATFRGKACIVASAVSKAILRSAMDEFLATAGAEDKDLFYFPAYEVITGSLHEPFTMDLRHPMLHTILFNMKVFERHFCDTGITDKEITDFMAEVRYRDYALNSDERPAIYQAIHREREEWQNDEMVPCIETVARRKAREDVIEARAEERASAIAQRKDEAEAKRLVAVAAREAGAEARKREAEQRRQD